MVVEHLGSGLLENLLGKDGGTGGKVVNPGHTNLPNLLNETLRTKSTANVGLVEYTTV